MRNIVIVLLLALVPFDAAAQKEIVHNLEKFTKIKVFDRIEATLIKSNENKVVITGDDRDEVSLSNKGGLLKIRMDLASHMGGGNTEVKVYYTDDLTLIDSNENAKIRSEETLIGKEIKIAVQEAGKIALKVEADKLEVKSTSGGEITLTGNVKSQNVLANTGGKVFNEKLESQETIVVVNAGGSANINASEKVRAKVRASGTIDIYGNPKQVERDKVLGGKITVRD